MCVVDYPAPVRALTRPPKHHFFGYYDHRQWEPAGRLGLGLEVEFDDRPPSPQDSAVIGVIDIEQPGSFRPLAQTSAWCWQQGTMLEWLPSGEGWAFIHNARDGDRYVSEIRDLDGKLQRTLPLPVYSVSADGKQALTLSFARLAHTRPGYGYVGIADPWKGSLAPDEDGIYLMNLETTEHQLVISLAQISSFAPRRDMVGAIHWFNHLLFSPEGRRFAFLHRWRSPAAIKWKARLRSALPGRMVERLRTLKGHHTVDDLWRHYASWSGMRSQLFTANADGSELCLLADEELVSHFAWRDETHILAWARRKDEGEHYYLFTDRSQDARIVGGDVLECDGHCSFSPNNRWIITDTYPDKQHMRLLVLYDTHTDTRYNLGRFYSLPHLSGEIRCDLHPRWLPDGKAVCIDSTHEGTRQMYVVDVTSLTA